MIYCVIVLTIGIKATYTYTLYVLNGCIRFFISLSKPIFASFGDIVFNWNWYLEFVIHNGLFCSWNQLRSKHLVCKRKFFIYIYISVFHWKRFLGFDKWWFTFGRYFLNLHFLVCNFRKLEHQCKNLICLLIIKKEIGKIVCGTNWDRGIMENWILN